MITLDNNVQFNDDTSGTTATFSFTTGVGDNRLLVVAVPESRTIGINSVTYNGLSLTLGRSTVNGANSARVYYMIAPPQGTYNIVVTYSASLTFRSVRASSFFGVEQTTPVGAITELTGNAQNKSLSITTTQDNSLVISCIGAQGGVHSPTSGQTWIGSSAVAQNRVAGWKIIPTAGSYTDTWSATTMDDYSYNLIEFKDAVEPTLQKGNIFFGFGA